MRGHGSQELPGRACSHPLCCSCVHTWLREHANRDIVQWESNAKCLVKQRVSPTPHVTRVRCVPTEAELQALQQALVEEEHAAAQAAERARARAAEVAAAQALARADAARRAEHDAATAKAAQEAAAAAQRSEQAALAAATRAQALADEREAEAAAARCVVLRGWCGRVVRAVWDAWRGGMCGNATRGRGISVVGVRGPRNKRCGGRRYFRKLVLYFDLYDFATTKKELFFDRFRTNMKILALGTCGIKRPFSLRSRAPQLRA